jgi:hypothetical protein
MNVVDPSPRVRDVSANPTKRCVVVTFFISTFLCCPVDNQLM